MKQIRTIGRRGLSLLLTAAMLMGLIVGVQFSTTVPASAGLHKESVKAPFSFQVPETIWLALNTGTSNQIARWSNQESNGNLPANPTEATGKVHFTVPGTVSSLVLSNDAGIAVGQPLLAGSTYTWTFTDDSVDQALAAGATRLVTWTLSCMMGGESLTFTHYSLLWAPTTVITGAGASAGVDGTWSSTLLTLLGADSITSSAYVPTALPGNQNNSPDDSIAGVYAASTTLLEDIVAGSISGSSTGSAHSIGLLEKNDGGGIAFGYWKDTGDNEPKQAVAGAKATVQVDNSRFENLQQVPGLRVNLLLTDRRDTKNSFGTDSSRVEFPEGTNLLSLSSTSAVPSMVVNESTPASGSKFSYSLTGADPQTISLYSHLRSYQSNWFGAEIDDIVMDYRTQLEITKVDRNALRRSVTAAVKYPMEWMDSPAAYAGFTTALQAAAEVLGHPRGPGDGAAQAAALDLQVEQTTPEAKDIIPVFYAPETIYLNPSTAPVTDQETWQYFADDDYTPAKGSSFGSPTADKAKPTGTLYFYCEAATSITITAEDLSNGASGTANLDIISAQRTTTTTSASNTRDIGVTFSGDNQVVLTLSDASKSLNQNALIRWTAEYIIDGTSYSSYAYSYIYKPYAGVTGTALAGRNEADIQMILWWLGLHGVTREPLSTGTIPRWPNENDTVKQNSVVSFDPRYGISTPLDYILDPSPDLTTLIQQGNVLRYFGGENTTPTSGPRPYRSETDGAVRDLLSTETTTPGEANGTGSIRFHVFTKGPSGNHSPMGQLYVDSSRYSNLKEVPNLDWLFLNTDDWGGQNSKPTTEDAKYWFFNQIGNNAIYIPDGTRAQHLDNNDNVGNIYFNSDEKVDDGTGTAQGFWSSGYRFGNKANLGIPRNSDAGDPGSGNAWGKADGGIRGSFSNISMADFPLWVPTTLKSSVGLYVSNKEKDGDWRIEETTSPVWSGSFSSGQTSTNGDWVTGIAQTQLSIGRVDKSDLRSKLQTEIRKGLQANQVTNWSAYLAAMDALALALCQPDYPLTSGENAALIQALAAQQVPAAAPEVYLNVPELIYLKPETGSSAAFQFFANNTAPGRSPLTPEASFGTPSSSKADPSGVIWFYVPGAEYISLHLDPDFVEYPDGASGQGLGSTRIQLSYLERPENGAPKDFKDMTLLDFDASTAATHYWSDAGAEWLYGEIDANTSYSANESKLVRWKGTYRLPGDSADRVVYAYSYIYRPYDGIYGAGQRARQDKSYNDSVIWFMGAHGVAKEPMSGNSPDGLSGIRQVWDYGNASDRRLSTLATPGIRISNPLLADSTLEKATQYLSSTSRTGDNRGAFSYLYTSYNTDKHGLESPLVDSPHGKLYVDVSRYTSLYDVPNFQWNTIQTNTTESDGTWLLEFPGINDNSNLTHYFNSLNIRFGHTASRALGDGNKNINLVWRMGPNLLSGSSIPSGYVNQTVTPKAGTTYSGIPGGSIGTDWRSTAYLMNRLDTLGRWDGKGDSVQYYHYIYGSTTDQGLASIDGGLTWNFNMDEESVTNPAERKDLPSPSTASIKYLRTRSRVVTDLRLVDKAPLRAQLQEVIAKSWQASDLGQEQWTDYQARIAQAAMELCRPDSDLSAALSQTLIDSLTIDYSAARNEHYNLAKLEEGYPPEEALAATEQLLYTLHETVTGAAWCQAGEQGARATVSAEGGYVFDHHALTLGSGTREESPATSSSVVARGFSLLWQMYYYPRYSIHFHPNSGEGEMEPQVLVYGTEEALNTNAFSKPEHVFLGWALSEEDAAAGQVEYLDEGVVKNLSVEPNAVIDLYAVWARVHYNATWVAGWVSPATNEMAPTDFDTSDGVPGDWAGNASGYYSTGFREGDPTDATYSLPFAAEPLRTGFTFRGWSKTEQDALDGVVEYQSSDFQDLTKYQLAAMTDSDETGQWYDREDPAYPDDVHKYALFWAAWQPNEYAVLFHANAGHFDPAGSKATTWGNADKQYYNDSVPYTALSSSTPSVLPGDDHHSIPVPVRSGYVFEGWALDADDTVVAFPHDFSLTIQQLAEKHSATAASETLQTLSFYAVWSEAPNYVSFDPNGGTFPETKTQPGLVYTNAPFSSAPNWQVPTPPPGKTFLGYARADDSTVTIDTTGSTLAAPEMFRAGATQADPTLFQAQYGDIVYYIQYQAEDGSPIGAVIPVTYGKRFNEFTLATAPPKAGHDFTAWVSDAPALLFGADGDLAIPTTLSTDADAPTLLTATYTPSSYYIVYDHNNGSGIEEDSTVTYGASYNDGTTPTPIPTPPAGYAFSHWASTGFADLLTGDETVPAGLSTDSAAPTQFTANYQPLVYTIAYDANEGSFGGSVDCNSSTVTFDRALSTGTSNPYATPVRAGYTFSGWTLQASDTVVIPDSDTLLNAALLTALGLDGSADDTTVTVYAKWSPKETTYKVLIHLQTPDGTGYTPQPYTDDSPAGPSYYGSAVTGEAVTLTNLPSIPHYTRNTAEDATALTQTVIYNGDGSNKVYTVFHLYYDRSSVTLNYALAADESFAGTPAQASEHLWGSSVTIAGEPTKLGYTFLAWEIQNGSGTLSGDKNALLQFAEDDVTLCPTWTPISYQLHYVLPSPYSAATGMPTENPLTISYDPSASTPAAAALELSGHTWAGWTLHNASKAGYPDGTVIPAGTPLPHDLRTDSAAIVTLTAAFAPTQYYIRYSGGGIEEDSTVTYGTPYNDGSAVPTPTPPTGMAFTHWESTGFGNIVTGDELVPAGLSTQAADPTVFSPCFTPISYTICYDPNQGRFANEATLPNSVATAFGSLLTQNDPYETPTRVGYHFAGWSLSSTGAVLISPQALDAAALDATLLSQLELSGSATGTATLYAIWTPGSTTAYTLELYLADAAGDYHLAKRYEDLTGTTASAPYLTDPYTLKSSDTPDYLHYAYASGNPQVLIAADGSTVYEFYYSRLRYTLTVDPANGTAPASSQHPWGSLVALPTEAPQKPGAVFTHWEVTTGPAVIDPLTGKVAMHQGDATLTAQYTALTYYLHFDFNGSTDPAVSPTTPYGEGKTYGDLSGFQADPQRQGYVFTGWLLSGAPAPEIIPADRPLPFAALSTSAADPTRYTAQWDPAQDTVYHVEVWQQQADGSYLKVDTFGPYNNGITGQSLTLSASQIPAAQAGYTRVTTYSAQTPITLDDQEVIAADGSTVFRYYFSRSAYTLTINNSGADSGTESPAAPLQWGDSYPVEPPVKAGYDFVQWHINDDEADGAAFHYDNASGKYIVTVGKGATVLTAEFAPKEYLLTYDYQDGSIPGSPADLGPQDSTVRFSQTYGQGSFWPNTEDASLPRLSKLGYIFSGWYAQPGGQGRKITRDEAIPADHPSAQTYYAYWTEGEVYYTVEIYLQQADGQYADTCASSTQYGATTGAAVSAGAEAYLSPYYTYTRPPVTGTAAADSSTVLKLYFDRVKVRLHYDLLGGSGKPAPTETFLWGSAYDIPALPIPTKDGYHFTGWHQTPTAGEDASISGDQVILGKTDTTVQVIWAANRFTLEFLAPSPESPGTPLAALDENGQSIPDASVTYQGTFPPLPTPQQLPGYRFIGWYDAAGKAVHSGDSVQFLTQHGGTAPLIAYYAAEYIIRYDATQGSIEETGSPKTTDRTVWWGATYADGIAAVGASFPSAAPPAGYVFAGWYTQPEGGTLVTADLPVPLLASPGYLPSGSVAPAFGPQSVEGIHQILYAHWDFIPIEPAPTPTVLPDWLLPVIGGGLVAAGLTTAVKVTGTLLGASLLGTLLVPLTALLPKLAKLLTPSRGSNTPDPAPDPTPSDPPSEPGNSTPSPSKPPVNPPSTGDSTPITLLAVLLMNGLAAGGLPLLRRRKREP